MVLGEGGGGGIHTLITLNLKKGTGSLNFQSNELLSKFLRQQMTIWKFLSDASRENSRCGWDTTPQITQNLINGTITCDYQSNMPPTKFIRSPFLYISLICPQGITYNRCPEGCGVAIIKNIISGPFNYFEQNGYLKILIGCVWGNGWRGGGLLPSNQFRLFNTALAHSVFNPLSFFSNFIRQQMTFSKFLSDAFRENARFTGEIHPPITLNLKKGTRIADFQVNEPILVFLQSCSL